MTNKYNEMKAGQTIKFNKAKEYEFVKALTPGGTGKTLLMRDVTIDKLFVCKKYDPIQKDREDEFYDRFVDEIKIMYSVYDNSIVRIYDYYLYPEYKTGYIIMEYIQGRDIDEYFMIEDEEKINSVFVQIINAFVYLEKNNILHRDIRAGNVIIDENDCVKIIDFGFGKNFQDNTEDQHASILLNWPASKIPNEIWREIYNEKTEIFYVGYLFKNIIEKYNIGCFKYSILLDRMIQVSPDDRIESFEAIQKAIAKQTFDDIKFSIHEKNIFQNFATQLCKMLCNIKDELIIERDEAVIIEKLRVILRDNSLEKYVTNVSSLLSCFIKSGYSYYNMEILMQDVKDFYNFFVNQTSPLRSIILNNLYGRLRNIPVIETTIDDELPFN